MSEQLREKLVMLLKPWRKYEACEDTCIGCEEARWKVADQILAAIDEAGYISKADMHKLSGSSYIYAPCHDEGVAPMREKLVEQMPGVENPHKPYHWPQYDRSQQGGDYYIYEAGAQAQREADAEWIEEHYHPPLIIDADGKVKPLMPENMVQLPTKDERRQAIVRIMRNGNVVHPAEVSRFILEYDRWLRERG